MATCVTTAVNIDTYKKLIAKKAWESFWKLPPQVRIRVDIEDMLQEGMLFARFEALPRWQPKRGAFITFLYTALDRHFKRSAEYYNAAKRYDGRTLALETVEKYWPTGGEDFVVNSHAVAALVRVYGESSEELKSYLYRWFFESYTQKIHIKGRRFIAAKKEFLLLSDKHCLRVSDCRFLLRNQVWQKMACKLLPENKVLNL